MKHWTKWKWINSLAKQTETWKAVNDNSCRISSQLHRANKRIKALEGIKEVYERAGYENTQVRLEDRIISITHNVSDRLFFESRMYGQSTGAFDWLAGHIASVIVHELKNAAIPTGIKP